MPQGTNVLVQTQKIVVNPSTKAVAVINAGPRGPAGPPGGVGPPGPGTPNEYVKADGSVPMTGPLYVPELWLPGGEVGARLTAAEASAAASVKKIGDKMTGRLYVKHAGPAITVQGNTNAPYVEFRSEDEATRYGYMLMAPTYARMCLDAANMPIYFRQASLDVIRMDQEGLFALLSASSPSNIVVGNATGTGARIRLHVPTSGNVCYLDFAGWGAAGTESMYFRAGTVNVLTLEDTVIRAAKAIYESAAFRAPTNSSLYGTNSAYLALYYAPTNVDTLGTRSGYMGFSGTDLYINNETGVNTRVLSGTGVVLLGIGSTERARLDTAGIFMVGRTSNASYYTDAGCDMRPSGNFLCTADTANNFPWLIRIGTALASGQRFLSMRTAVSGSGTEIGSITMNGTAATAFNTTSHGPFKGNVEDLDDDEAIARVEKWRPVAYQWKFDEDGQLAEDGVPQGEVKHGFIAQEMNEINPSAVTPGYGTWEEHVEWRTKQQAYSAALSEYTVVEAEQQRIIDDNQAVLQPWQEECQRLEALWNEESPTPLILPIKPALKEMPVLPELPEQPSELSPFQSWQGDWSDLVPDLSAAVQALIRQNRAMAARIDELERSAR